MKVIGSAALAGTAFPSAGLAAGLGWAAGGWESAATTPENCRTKNGTAVSRQFRPNMAALEWAISLATARSRRSTSRWVRFWAGASLAVGELRRDEDSPLRALFHQLQHLGPTGNHASVAGSQSAFPDRPNCRRRSRRSRCRDSGRARVSSSSGFLPVPSLRTRYCKPLAVVFTPGFFLFSARNSSPFFLLTWPLETLLGPAHSPWVYLIPPHSRARRRKPRGPPRPSVRQPTTSKHETTFPSVLRQKSAAT